MFILPFKWAFFCFLWKCIIIITKINWLYSWSWCFFVGYLWSFKRKNHFFFIAKIRIFHPLHFHSLSTSDSLAKSQSLFSSLCSVSFRYFLWLFHFLLTTSSGFSTFIHRDGTERERAKQNHNFRSHLKWVVSLLSSDILFIKRCRFSI